MRPMRFRPIGGTETSPAQKSRHGPKKRQQPQAIDKGALALPEPRRVRDREHVRYVAQQPCLICGRRPSDAHHLRFAQSRALGRKVSDEFTVPSMPRAPSRGPSHGDEAAWWQKIGIDPATTARLLWLETHPLAASSQAMDGDVASSPPSATSAVGAKPRAFDRSTVAARITKRTQLLRSGLDDVFQTVASQPAQCRQKHRAGYGRRQTAFSLQCRPPRPYG